ncbi:zinc ribbon domain-containing protein [Bacillus rhizoplanae]|uniref:zinc ribbon domain-containing protein n=1 Tax=Bacillus rhizoplanae TaxID=2880966 RepID=UPI003D1A7FFA
MTCPNCKTENTNEAKFCGSCGHSLIEPVAASSRSVNQSEERVYQAAPVQENRSNEVLNQMKQFTGNYFRFFKNALKSPTAIMKSEYIEVRNGITSLALICFLFTCIFYRMMSATASIATSFVPEATTPSFFGESFKVFLFLLVLFLFIGFIVFFSGKLMKSSFSFLEALGVWGAVSTPVIALLVITLLFSLLSIFLLPLFLGLALTCMSVCTIVSIVKLDRGGLDSVYTLIIAHILITIVCYIVLGAYVQMIFDTLLGGLKNF